MAWWKKKVDEIYAVIPDFGGFVLKADSEGRLGPSKYGRTHADAANALAAALQPHGGILLYRGFVYDHHLDWRNLKNDRARAAYDNFHALDGRFEDNAAVQIKYGPIDFQVREPVSPLIGALRQTNETLELQITQEYTGQQRHVCFLVPMWKEILDFDLRVDGGRTPVKEIVAGKAFHRPLGGLVGVANVGRDLNWLGSDLAMANLYGFGRLAWNPDLSSRQIADEWTRLTFGNDDLVANTIDTIQLESWRVYEGYTGPLGLGTLTDILHSHYGPGIESSERNGWGQWIRADHEGIGMDRTVATGTGYIGQYSPEVAQMYESLKSTPDNLLLFMHHVPYTYVLHSGQTVIQHVYDSHYDAAAEAQQFPEWWKSLRGRVDEGRYNRILAKLEYQAGHAIVWRDAVCSWFLHESGIADEKGRAGHFPNRVEAESMTLKGYTVEEITPWEDASGGKAITCETASESCSASFPFRGAAGWYRVAVQYFDVSPGGARFQLFVNHQAIDSWTSSGDLPFKLLNGDTSTRRTVFPYRSAERESELILLQVLSAQCEEAACIQIAVAEKLESFAVKLVAPTLRRDVHHGSVWSLVRHEKILLDLELINCRSGDIQRQFSVPRSADRYAVEGVANRVRHRAGENNRPPRLSHIRGKNIAGSTNFSGASGEQTQLEEVPAV